MLGFVAKLNRLFLAALFACLSSAAFAAASSLFDGSFGSEDGSHATLGSHSAMAKTRPGDHVMNTVDISTQKMTVETDRSPLYTWDVSTGRTAYSTPAGNVRPIRMHQIWYSSKYENSPMPWSIFFCAGYAIDGTGDLKYLGSRASHGCLQLDPRSAKVLYDLVQSWE